MRNISSCAICRESEVVDAGDIKGYELKKTFQQQKTWGAKFEQRQQANCVEKDEEYKNNREYIRYIIGSIE